MLAMLGLTSPKEGLSSYAWILSDSRAVYRSARQVGIHIGLQGIGFTELTHLQTSTWYQPVPQKKKTTDLLNQCTCDQHICTSGACQASIYVPLTLGYGYLAT
jgi:hypothetical protein